MTLNLIECFILIPYCSELKLKMLKFSKEILFCYDYIIKKNLLIFVDEKCFPFNCLHSVIYFYTITLYRQCHMLGPHNGKTSGWKVESIVTNPDGL